MQKKTGRRAIKHKQGGAEERMGNLLFGRGVGKNGVKGGKKQSGEINLKRTLVELVNRVKEDRVRSRTKKPEA